MAKDKATPKAQADVESSAGGGETIDPGISAREN